MPLTLQPLAVTRGVSIETVNRALGSDRLILLVLQDNESEDPGPEDLRKIGTVGVIRQMAKAGLGINIILEGIARVRLDSVTRAGTSMRARITPMPETFERTLEVDAHVRRIQELIDKTLSLASGLSEELRGLVMNIDDPLRLVYVLATLLDLRPPDKQAILEENDLVKKLQAVATALTREVSLLELKGKIESQAQQEMTDAQRQYFLRQQMKAIQQELGEGEGAELVELRARIDAANLPEAIYTVATREVERLARMTGQSPEYQMIRTYLDWILELPWSVTTEDRLDPVEARRVLDDDHYDLDKVKERIVEYLAVRKLKGDMKGPILCFVGPPGVGKTSLGQSIARAMNRKFVRISLGGVRDEAEIRGHRRTYIGSIPGRIVQALKQAGSMNPVFMLDEIDKMAAGFQGDPAAALLEVLDPAQNHSFRDHYLETPVDLSRVLFIATSNQLGTVHPALLDRMEIIQLAGYTEEEKVHIARRYLLPRQMSEHGLAAGGDGRHRRRAADRHQRVHPRGGRPEPRAAARDHCPEGGGPHRHPAGRRPGPRKDRRRRRRGGRLPGPGPVQEGGGLPDLHAGGGHRAWPGPKWAATSCSSKSTLLPGGNQNIILTGQLGNVMQESARAALSHIRSRAEALGISPEFLAKHDLHIHVPGGRHPEGRSVRRHHHSDGDFVCGAPSGREAGRGDDRRNHAQRAGAAGWRHSGEGAGGAAVRGARRSCCRRSTNRTCWNCPRNSGAT